MKVQLFEITHTTTYEYHAPVPVSHHLMRLTPRSLSRQRRIEHVIEVDPAPAATTRRMDYFGNDVTFVTIEQIHSRLCITSRSQVAVGPAFIPDPYETPGWESVRGLCRTDRTPSVLEATEYTFASPNVPLDPSFAEYAAPSFEPDRAILEAVTDLTARIHHEFTFDATATTVSTRLARVLEDRRGVCQDFAHLQIACLRALGLPARYVSGYLETQPPPGQEKLVGSDASHAWVSFFCPGIGWIDVDPTNNLFPSMQHITLGWGRDYSDVSPVRGVILGAGNHDLRVAVDVVPLERGDPADLEDSSN
jgi:transglutaminase-like putative cysteine protease